MAAAVAAVVMTRSEVMKILGRLIVVSSWASLVRSELLARNTGFAPRLRSIPLTGRAGAQRTGSCRIGRPRQLSWPPVASRREEKEQRRRERLEIERAKLEEARKRRVYSIVAGGVLLVGATVAVIVAVAAGGGSSSSDSAFGFSKTASPSATPPPEKIADLQQAAKAAGCILLNPPIEGRTHVTGKVKYHTNPPTSGNHYPIPQDDGVYKQTPPFTHLVHTLEHGRIEIQYKSSIDPKRIAQLGGLYNADKSYTVLFPNSKMPYRVAVTAWGHLAGCKKVNDATFDLIRDFKRRYLGTGPEPLETQPTNF
jgi:hypothetical protein